MMFRINNLRINWKKFLASGGMIFVLSTTGCIQDKVDKIQLPDVISENATNTYFDEYVEKNTDLEKCIQDTVSLEQYVDLSEVFHKLDFKRDGLIDLENKKLMSIQELNKLIKKYDKRMNLSDSQRNELEYELNIQEKIMNKKIYDGYFKVAKIAYNYAKVKVADALEIPFCKIDEIVLPGRDEYENSDKSFLVSLKDTNEMYKVKIKRFSELDRLFIVMYDMQARGSFSSNAEIRNWEQYNYNAERNKFILNGLNEIRKVADGTAVVVKVTSNGEYHIIDILDDKEVKKLSKQK